MNKVRIGSMVDVKASIDKDDYIAWMQSMKDCVRNCHDGHISCGFDRDRMGVGASEEARCAG